MRDFTERYKPVSKLGQTHEPPEKLLLHFLHTIFQLVLIVGLSSITSTLPTNKFSIITIDFLLLRLDKIHLLLLPTLIRLQAMTFCWFTIHLTSYLKHQIAHQQYNRMQDKRTIEVKIRQLRINSARHLDWHAGFRPAAVILPPGVDRPMGPYKLK